MPTQPATTVPSHGSNPTADTSSTAPHPPPDKPDTTTSVDASQGRLAASASTGASELSSLKIRLRSALRQFPDFPTPGILFEDILPIFADSNLHEALQQALSIHIEEAYGESNKPDVIVGLDARGFLFGPTLALRLGAAFVPVRKKGKLPGPTETASFKKEYGEDFFQIQKDGIKSGQKVLVVDDIIATGGSAAAAGSLVNKLGGNLLGYIFILELDFLKGRDQLTAPVFTLLTAQDEKS